MVACRRRQAAAASSAPGTTTRGMPAEVPWLQPYPDALLNKIPDRDAGPETATVARETIELTFIAAIQSLPPRRRAVVLLCAALGFSGPRLQRPRRQRGLRFSRNAFMPSRASGSWLVAAMTSTA